MLANMPKSLRTQNQVLNSHPAGELVLRVMSVEQDDHCASCGIGLVVGVSNGGFGRAEGVS